MEKKTVFITGSSSGIGRATALYFQEKGWNVVASMRSPEKEAELSKLPGVICPKLDVTRPESIEKAIQIGIERFGSIDVLVNNAGYALSGVFEAATEEQVRRQYETNVFGLLKVTQVLIPHFRSRRAGVIVNISSMAGRVTFPFYSLYCGTKWAVEGITESLRYELEPFGIRLKLIEPGLIKTDFFSRSSDKSLGEAPEEYHFDLETLRLNTPLFVGLGSNPGAVAKVVFKASTDRSRRLRYPGAGWGGFIMLLAKILRNSLFSRVIRIAFLTRWFK